MENKKIFIDGDAYLVQKDYLENLEQFRSSFDGIIDLARILHLAKQNKPCSMNILEYGILIQKGEFSCYFATHDAGLCSVLATIMVSMIDIKNSNFAFPLKIDNSSTMKFFKNKTAEDNFSRYFQPPESEQVSILQNIELLKHEHFDTRVDYSDTFYNHLGSEWVTQYLQTYMNPTNDLADRIKHFIDKYSITKKSTLVLCFRGTDREIRDNSFNDYLIQTDKVLQEFNVDQIIIQTDQHQVRDRVASIYGERCIFLEELPVTSGPNVIHFTNIVNNKDEWCLNLLAAIYALSNCRYIVTYTGNMGFFLSLMGIINGSKIFQMR